MCAILSENIYIAAVTKSYFCETLFIIRGIFLLYLYLFLRRIITCRVLPYPLKDPLPSLPPPRPPKPRVVGLVGSGLS